MTRILLHVTFTVLLTLVGNGLGAQEARVRTAPRVEMPTAVDSNSPAFWRDGRLHWFGSHGYPRLSEGPNQFGPWQTRDAWVESATPYPSWIEAVWPENDGLLWGWYHAEPGGLVPDSEMTVPHIGAVVSYDGGETLFDLGVVLESGEPLNPRARNGYFAGGHGDFSVIVDRQRQYFYFFFDNYGGEMETQGVCVARMAMEDRSNPTGKVWKYHAGEWREAGRGGRVSPIFPVQKSWAERNPDALWGPSVHWNTYLNCYVMLLNRAQGEPGWAQEGIYVSFAADLSRPETWTQPRKILDKSQFPGWYFFYPQVMGLEPGGTDRLAGQVARLYVGGISKWEIEFSAAAAAPTEVVIAMNAPREGVVAGQRVVLSVAPMGQPPFTYQWWKDGVAIPGATEANYTISAAGAADAGRYTVIVTNALGTATSQSVQLEVTGLAPGATPETVLPPTPLPVEPTPEAFLANLSVRARLESSSDALTVGFGVTSEAGKRLGVRAVGPSLAAFGVTSAASDPQLEVFDAAGGKVAENQDWFSTDADLFAAVGAFPLPIGSADAALTLDVANGAGTAVVRSPEGGTALVELYDLGPSGRSKLVNLSALASVGAGSRGLIGGLHVGGTGAKRVLVRALGPQLTAYGVRDPLADPVLEVFDGDGVLVARNDNWDAEGIDAADALVAPPLSAGSRDAALGATLSAGKTYTIVVSSADGSMGRALLEVYEVP